MAPLENSPEHSLDTLDEPGSDRIYDQCGNHFQCKGNSVPKQFLKELVRVCNQCIGNIGYGHPRRIGNIQGVNRDDVQGHL